MTVYVDEPTFRGQMYCRMAVDGDIEELHRMARRIGLKRECFQDKEDRPHYDLSSAKRALAVKYGAVEVSPIKLVGKCFKTPFENIVEPIMLENPKHKTEKTATGWIEYSHPVRVEVTSVSVSPILHYGDTWVRISQKIGRQGYNRCLRCQQEFSPGDPVHITFTNKGNKWVCASCAAEITAYLAGPTGRTGLFEP